MVENDSPVERGRGRPPGSLDKGPRPQLPSIRRALRGAKAVGLDVASVEIDLAGKITLVTRTPGEEPAPTQGKTAWDDDL
jgi:hypothetical protein